MMSTGRDESESDSPEIEETEFNGESAEVSHSSQDPLNDQAGRRPSPPPVPPPPPPPNDGAPPRYTDQKPPEYNEAIGLLYANRIQIVPASQVTEEMGDNPPPNYVELHEMERPGSRCSGSVSPSCVNVEEAENSDDAAHETSQPPSDVPYVDVESGTSRARRFYRPFVDLFKKHPWLLIVMPIVSSFLVVFLAVFPVSFEYIHYHEIALKRSVLTGWVDFSRTYYAGCYVVGPEFEFLRFPATSQTVEMDLSVTSSSALSYHINLVIVYELNSTKLPLLYRKFATNYLDPMKAFVGSTVKNKAVSINMDEWFLNRRVKEKEIEDIIKVRLRPYHIDVTDVFLQDIVFPKVLLDRMIRRVVLDIKSETERYILEERVESKKTDEMTNEVLNSANEVNAAAVASAKKIEIEATATARVVKTLSNGDGLKSVKSNVSLTGADQMLSYFFLKSLDSLALNERLVIASRNGTKSYNKASGTFADNLAVAAAGLAKVKP